MTNLILGKNTPYPDRYDPDLLFAIPREKNRRQLNIAPNSVLPFMGVDIWNAYELSWLNIKGKPQIAIGEFTIPADSTYLIESKSLKLYLNSLNQMRFLDITDLKKTMQRDLSKKLGLNPQIEIRSLDTEALIEKPFKIQEMNGKLLDRLDIDVDPNLVSDPLLLRADRGAAQVSEILVSQLLKSNCPVTGQPDWASVQIKYHGCPINEEGLLRYLISFRNVNEFHEHCVETIFCDLLRECKPEKLSVYARYTRRGGLDINPFRTNHNALWPSNIRHARQ